MKKEVGLLLVCLILILVVSSYLVAAQEIYSIDSEKEVVSVVSDKKAISSVISEQKEISLAKPNSYIIQFKNEPLVKKKVSIEKEISELRSQNLVTEAETKEKAKEKNILSHKSVLKKEHEDALLDIESKIKTKSVTGKIIFNIKRITGNIIARITGFDVLESSLKPEKEFYNVFNGIVLDEISKEKLEKIKKSVYVKEVYPNMIVNVTLMDSAPLINADDVWKLKDSQNRTVTGKNVTIAIIDTGVDYTHPDLGGCFGINCKVVGGYDFVNCTQDDVDWGVCLRVKPEDSNPIDDHGHGTHVAGIAAGSGAGGLKGIAYDAKLYAYKVLSSEGAGYTDWVISGIERAVDPNQDTNFADHLDIISMSLGGYGDPDDALSQAVDNAVDAGIVVVVAAGNSGPWKNTISSPGTARKAITVGATYKKNYWGAYWDMGEIDPKVDQITSFSSRGPVIWANGSITKPDVVAPGAIICSARYDYVDFTTYNPLYKLCLDKKHVQLAGTSMATPMVAGAVALLKQKNPEWNPEEIKAALRNTAKKLIKPETGEVYDINTQGYGRIDVLNAIQLTETPVIAEINTNGMIKGDIIDITGTAKGREFSNYTLYYGEGKNPVSWIEITKGNSPIDNGILYSGFNTSFLYDGYNSLKLVVWDIKGKTSEDLSYVFFCKSCQKGWPYKTNGQIGSSPVIKDINKDGKLEILITSTDGNIYLLDYEGKNLPGWPKPFPAKEEGGFYSDPFINNLARSVPVIADIDNDGEDEIIARGSIYLYVWNLDGSDVPGWPRRLETSIYGNGIVGSVSVADLDNDGFKEIVTGHYDKLHVFNYDGNYKSGWPKSFSSKSFSTAFKTPTFADLDKDGNLEVIFEANIIENGSSKIYVGVWNYKGIDLNNWPKKLNSTASYSSASPLVGDVDNDGNREIIVPIHNKIYVFDINGLIKKGWPISLGSVGFLALGDLNNDRYLEILTGWSTIEVYLYRYNGSLVNNWPKRVSCFYTFSPTSGDIDNDSESEFILGDWGGCSNPLGKVHAWDYNGALVKGWPKETFAGGIESAPSLGDLDNDGDIEVVAGSKDGYIYVWDLNGTYNPETMHWPQFQHDPQHTGCYDCEKNLTSVTCTDSDNGLNYYVKGLIKTRDEEIWDSCKDSSILLEGTCDEAGGKTYEYVCPYGCSDGACKATCYNDSDCPGATETKYCNETSACISRTSYSCIDPGTTNSSCVGSSAVSCSPCSYGCENGACVNQTIINQTNLAAYYKFDSDANDFSGNNNNGVPVGNPIFVPGVKGDALKFNGNNYVTVPDSPVLNFGNNSFSILTWIYPENLQLKQVLVDKAGSSNNGYRFSVDNNNNKKLKLIKGYDYSKGVASNQILTQGKWQHIVVVYNNSSKTVNFYINGTKNSEVSYTRTNPATSFTNLIIAGYSTTSGSPKGFIGVIDELRIYNGALPSSEILEIYNKEKI